MAGGTLSIFFTAFAALLGVIITAWASLAAAQRRTPLWLKIFGVSAFFGTAITGILMVTQSLSSTGSGTQANATLPSITPQMYQTPVATVSTSPATAVVTTIPLATRAFLQGDGKTVSINNQASLPSPLLVSVKQPDSTWRIAIVRPGASKVQYIDTHGHAYDPAVSPDRHNLAFTTSSGEGNSSIQLQEIVSGSSKQISPSGNLNCRYPSWSPESRYIAFSCEVPNQELTARIYVYDVQTEKINKLEAQQGGFPDWSVENQIVFEGRKDNDVNNSIDLFLVNPDGTDLRNITNSDDYDEETPSWSPDGSQITYAKYPTRQSNQSQISVMNLKDGTIYQISIRVPGPNSNPVWSPIGQTIAFINEATDGQLQPWLIQSDGTQLRQLSGDDSRMWYIHWLPQGQS